MALFMQRTFIGVSSNLVFSMLSSLNASTRYVPPHRTAAIDDHREQVMGSAENMVRFQLYQTTVSDAVSGNRRFVMGKVFDV